MGQNDAPQGGRPPKPWGQSLIRAFGSNVRRHRKYRRLTQTDLAYLAHLHPAAVSEIERCSGNPTLRTVHALALALQCDPQALVNRQLYRSTTFAKQVMAVTGETVSWCVARHPEFGDLKRARQHTLEQAVSALLVVGHWFDGQVLGGPATRAAIVDSVAGWDTAGLVRPNTFAAELEHFRNRYVGPAGAVMTLAFEALNIRSRSDRKCARDVLLDVESDAAARAQATLIIVKHLREGLFRAGWLETGLDEQIDDLQHATTALQRGVEIDERARRLKEDGA